MSGCSDATIAKQIVELLSGANKSALLTITDFREAILDLVKQGGENFHEQVSNILGGDRRARKVPKTSNVDLGNDDVAAFFEGKRGVCMSHVRKALKALEASPVVETSHCQEEITRQRRMMQQYRACEKQTYRAEGQRRILMVVIASEIHRLQEEGGGSSLDAAEHKFARLSGENPKNISGLCKRAHKYEVLAREENSLGFLLMLGSTTRDVWERNLNETSASLIWKFCKAHRPSLIERAKELQPEACEIVRRCFNNDEYRVFWYDTNVFTRHFREAGEQQDLQHYRPQAPIVTIQQYQQASEVGVQQAGSASDLGIVNPNVWGQHELFSTNQQSQMPGTTPSNHLNLASTTNMPIYPVITPHGYDLGLDNNGSAHGVHASATEWATNGPAPFFLSSDPDRAQSAVHQNTLSGGIPGSDADYWNFVDTTLLDDF